MLEEDRPAVFELCRYVSGEHHDALLANETERRVSIASEKKHFLQLDEWHHPDLSAGQLPSRTGTFRSLAKALETGDPSCYAVSEASNNDWRNWPDGGAL